MIVFESKLHTTLFNMMLRKPLPCDVDALRITVAYFALSGLDILGKSNFDEEFRRKSIRWIYTFFCNKNDVAGFLNFNTFAMSEHYWNGHIAATYSALNTLVILGDDLSGIDKRNVISSLKQLQLPDGSFVASKFGTENDMRFVYCAAVICYILNDWSGMDVDRVVDYILRSISYDGGFGQGPHLESHGGSTFCAVATLHLTNNLHKLKHSQKQKLIKWLLSLQTSGFQGRPNKESDTCYTFWVGATLKMLNADKFIHKESLLNFVLASQDFRIGGFSRWPDYEPDPLHTYFSLAGLSVMQFDGLREIVPSLILSQRAFDHLISLHNKWRTQMNCY